MNLLRLLPIFLFFSFFPLQANTISGTLAKAVGESAPATDLVFVSTADGEEAETSTDAEGIFVIDLPSGEYDVFQKHDYGRRYIARVNLFSGEGRKLNLILPEQGDSSLEAIRDYEISTVPAPSIDSEALADMINPFPAKKRGRLSGSIYEFHRNDNFDARNFFDPVGQPLPEYKRNQFGATLGAIVGTKWYFQGSYDGLRIVQGSTLLSHVPTAAMKAGDFSGLDTAIIDPATGEPFPGNQIPQDRISSVSRRLLSVIEDPNRDDPDRNFVNNDPVVRDQDALRFRGDYEPSTVSKVSFDYGYVQEANRMVQPFSTFNRSRQERHQSVGLSYNRTISERFLSYSRVNFNRNRNFSLSNNSGSDGLLESIGIAGVAVEDPIEEGYPYFDIVGYADFGDRNSPSTSIRNRIAAETSMTYVFNNHTFRASAEIGNRQLNNYRSDGLHRGSFAYNGTYTGDGFADFLLGIPDAAYRGIGSDRSDLRRLNWEFFISDQWRITPNFSFTYGISYRYFQPFYSIHDNVSGFYPLLFEPPVDGEIVVAGSERASQLGFDGAQPGSLVFPDRNDWAPRLGFSFNPLGSNRLVFRASYSVWYEPPGEWAVLRSLGKNYPFYYTEGVESSNLEPEIFIEHPFDSGTEPELSFRDIEPRLNTPHGHYWRLSFQNEVARNWNLELSYVGRQGQSALRTIPGNVPLPGEGQIQERRPNPEFGKFSILTDGGSFSGHGLEASAERRLAKGLALRSGFEWNRLFDDAPWGDPSNPRGLRSERAQAMWAREKRFFLNYIIELPFGMLADSVGWGRWAFQGWRISGITEIHEGDPLTITYSGDKNNDGVWGDRPDRIGSGVLDPSERSIDAWFDTSAFTDPTTYGFGTAGRNILDAPNYKSWDISVIKQTRFSDGDLVEFRIEFFNAFNNVNFSRPVTDLNSSTFGKIFGADRAREIELALKYSF
ncbi:MAG: TonB-dependent receptor [Acidobacteriota bacterium]|nr:MAG: TonB-dependent receptor [Acidobacteriota bacterium]